MNRTDFLIEKERVMAQWKLLEEMVDLIYYSHMESKEVIEHEIEKTWNEIERLKLFEERYCRK